MGIPAVCLVNAVKPVSQGKEEGTVDEATVVERGGWGRLQQGSGIGAGPRVNKRAANRTNQQSLEVDILR